jgi:DNA-binding response OmpR family regulator
MIVEDDVETARLNARMIKRRGYDVLIANSAAQAREIAQGSTPDLIVMDVILPDGDGFALCQEFRLDNDAPIIFLTGKKSTEDKITGLSGGGDYYLTKPYDLDELIVVVERLLHKTAQTRKKIVEASVIVRGSLTLQIPQRTALVNGRDAGLTPKEFAVLLMLVQNEDTELASEKIYERVWNTPMNSNSGALRVQITRLKKKLGEESTDDFSILHMHGKGYIFTTK